jgi:hypothetical protein
VYFGLCDNLAKVHNRLRDMILRCTTTCVLLFSFGSGTHQEANQQIFDFFSKFFSKCIVMIDDVFSLLPTNFSHVKQC